MRNRPWRHFAAIQWSPTRSRYMVSYPPLSGVNAEGETQADTLVKVYREVK